jgi:acyl carrier protein
MLDTNKIHEIIFEALEAVNAERDEGEKIIINSETVLFGDEASLDSLDLVSVLVDVESALLDVCGFSVSLTDDRAMDQEISPFSNIHNMTKYILSIV